MDTLDQMTEQINRITEGQAPPRAARHTFAYVVYIKGRWHVGSFKGTGGQCSEYIEKKERVDLGDRSVKWARGHVGTDGTFVIHPQNDRDAVHTLTRLLQSKQAKQRRR